MVPPLGDRAVGRDGRMIHTPPASNQANSLIDRDQAFQLIDRVLPFEACLYYQILPLSLAGSRLRLGMVNLTDAAALEYVRRILAYLHCSLAPQTIPSDIHYSTLSAYLNYSGKAQQSMAAVTQPISPVPPTDPAIVAPVALESAAVMPAAPSEQFLVHHAVPEIDKSKSARQAADDRATLLLKPDGETSSAAEPQAAATVIQSFETLPLPQLPPGNALPELTLAFKYLESPIEQLATLPPAQLLQELLGRVLGSGIGRLYFERNAQGGRILWSKDGVLRSVLDHLSAEVLQALIDALKQLAHVEAGIVQTPRQVEVERLYRNDRLLLRLRLMTNEYGEEATFQVLRGPALKFYQQQQLLHLSRSALGIARNLYQKVSELRDRTAESVPAEHMLVMTEIDRVMRKVNQQLTDLTDRPTALGQVEFRPPTSTTPPRKG